MIKFLAPLISFCVGMVFILVSFLFFPAIGNTADTAAASLGSTTMNHYWGLTWLLSGNVVKLVLFLVGLAFVLYGVAVVWIKRK